MGYINFYIPHWFKLTKYHFFVLSQGALLLCTVHQLRLFTSSEVINHQNILFQANC